MFRQVQLYFVPITTYCTENEYLLIYCIEIWGISPQTHLNPLLLMQKKIVRIMTFSYYYAHTAPIFRDLE